MDNLIFTIYFLKYAYAMELLGGAYQRITGYFTQNHKKEKKK